LQHAQSLPGFDEETVSKFDKKEILVGFGREAITGHADKVIT